MPTKSNIKNLNWKKRRVTLIVLIVFFCVHFVKLIKLLISYIIFFFGIIPNLHTKFRTFKFDRRADSLGNMSFTLATTNPSTTHTEILYRIGREQGIDFNCILDYRIKDYMVALKRIIKDPKLIIAASKVS